uniref:RING-type domain-containing protein n=2 Tax=Chinchilla lanigera TaxID=34839 RepID=A0A8C2VDF0_CHILA
IGNIVVIMISHPKAQEILDLIEKGILVKMTILSGTSHVQLTGSHQPFAFLTIMIFLLSSIVFYCVQYFLFTSSTSANQSCRKATKEVIDQLPLHTVKHEEKDADLDAENCAVCIEHFKVNDLIRILPCKHIFHSICIDPWLLDHRTCPMCKLDVIKALRYWGQPGGGRELPAAESDAGSAPAETLRGVFLPEDRSVGSNRLSPSSSSSPSPSEPGPQCPAKCAEDVGKNAALLGDSVKEAACV